MCYITLTTDFTLADYSVGALKGYIYKLIPNVTIVDISHHITRSYMVEAVYMLKNAYYYFPDNTIHIIGVDNELSAEKKLLVMKYKNQFFIFADNGFASMFNEELSPKDIYYIDAVYPSTTFPTILSVQVAQFIVQNQFSLEGKLPNIESLKNINYKIFPVPVTDNQMIKGKIIHIDSFGNIVSNISREIIDTTQKFNICFGTNEFKNYNFSKILTQYDGIKDDDEPFIFVFNHSGFLELSRVGASATDSFRLKIDDEVSIKYLP